MLTNRERLDAYREGQEAARAGAPYRVNPYTAATELALRCHWSAGYWDERDLMARYMWQDQTEENDNHA